MHPFERNGDNTTEKNIHRAILDELSARHSSLLATDYPGEYGRKFLKKLLKDRPKLAVTLCNKKGFHRTVPSDGLSRVEKETRDIFEVILYNPATLVEIDLFGGFPQYGKINIERGTNWKQLFLTFSRAWRHHTLKGALKKDEDPALFMEEWCAEQGWEKPIMPQLPYPVVNKNMQTTGPKFWTFILTRR